ncbi:MAG: hypothetical protein EHM23_01945 [Acidobacteria bacterium]|nr:MAG: hypothetical protein EHM23_25870 [Acidobacteriota bacterium]RPJ63319.1 MAG: hypothetical protein EHM23_01945 [Acidobacteriota bacterium]
MRTAVEKNPGTRPCLSWLGVVLIVLTTGGCKQLEEVVDTPPDYYYCLRATYPGLLGIDLLPGEVAVVRIDDGPCILTWNKAERLPISGAMPFVVRALSLDDGIHVTPLGVTSSSEIRVTVDASLADTPWMLSSPGGQSAHIAVTLQNPRQAARGYQASFYVWVKNPFDTAGAMAKSRVSLRANHGLGLSFQTVKVGSQASRVVVVFNEGSEDAKVANVALANCSPSPCPFAIAGGLAPGSTIRAGSSGMVTVVFQPAQAGFARVDLFINPTEGYPIRMSLYGTGQ